VQQYKPDLLFLDIQMPGMSGFEVLAHLPQESLPVVVFVTAYDQYAIEDPAMNALVPSLLLQPLLENSLKYAVSAREQGGMVRIEGRAREAWLELSVIDDGPGLREGTPVSERRGVGLHNTSERLAVLYGDNHRFSVGNANPGLRVDMALPLELAEPGHEALGRRADFVQQLARGAHA